MAGRNKTTRINVSDHFGISAKKKRLKTKRDLRKGNSSPWPRSSQTHHQRQHRQLEGIAREVSCIPDIEFFLKRKKTTTLFPPSLSHLWIRHGRRSQVSNRPWAFGCLQRHRDCRSLEQRELFVYLTSNLISPSRRSFATSSLPALLRAPS